MKSWLGFANYALTHVKKKILEHDFNTSVYTHSHLFDVFCETILFENDMSWIEEGTIVWHEKKCFLVRDIGHRMLF